MFTLSEIQSECSISFVWASVCPKILRALLSSHKQTQGMLTCCGTELLCPGPEPWRDLPNLDLSVNAPFATPITTTREWHLAFRCWEGPRGFLITDQKACLQLARVRNTALGQSWKFHSSICAVPASSKPTVWHKGGTQKIGGKVHAYVSKRVKFIAANF